MSLPFHRIKSLFYCQTQKLYVHRNKIPFWTPSPDSNLMTENTTIEQYMQDCRCLY